MSNTISSGGQGAFLQNQFLEDHFNKLVSNNIISFNDPSYQNNPDMLKLKDEIKHFHINTDNLNLSQDSKNSRDDLKAKLQDSMEEQTKILGQYNNSDAYYTFEGIISSMHDIDDSQKSQLRNAIITAAQTAKAPEQQGDSYGMLISQTNFELKYVTKNLVPEEYQDKFNELADSYTKKVSDEYLNMTKSMAEQIANSDSPVLVETGWCQRGQQMLDDLNNGTDIFQATSRIYQGLYNKIDTSKPDTVKSSLDSVYNDILTNGTGYTRGSSDSNALSADVNYLKEQWNNLMDKVPNGSNQKFVTSLDFYA